MATTRSTPQPATGADFRLYYAEEVTEATMPSGNWTQLPCVTFEVVGDQTLTQDQVLSTNQGRDASEPYLDGVQTVKGNAKVPIDLIAFGHWLKLLFGAPVTTGSGPYVHTYTSGGLDATMFSASFEKAFPLISKFYHDVGCRADSISITTTPSGAAEATIAILGLMEGVPTTTSQAGTPVQSGPLSRFMQMSGQILLGGTALAGVTAGTITFANNIKAAVAIRGDNRAESLDYGQATGGGSVTLRFTGIEGIDAVALAVTPLSLSYSLTSGTSTLTFTFPNCYFKPVGPAVSTPDAITRDYTFIAANLGTGSPLLTVTYTNGVATY